MKEQGQLCLAVLETAPDRQTAEMMLLAALHSNVSPERLRASWARWEQGSKAATRRGEA